MSPLTYVLSDRFAYDRLISDDAGPGYARAYGFVTTTLSTVSIDNSRLLILDNRLHRDEMPAVRELLRTATDRGASVLLKIVDPVTEFPNGDDYYYELLHEMRDQSGIHYLTVYDPERTAPELFRMCRHSRQFHLPYAYEISREVNRAFKARRHKIFLSGALGGDIYPLRTVCYRFWRRNPVGRLLVFRLPHPGYPDVGHSPKHGVVHGRFLEAMARYKYAFVCGRREGIELQKYRDCAYAGCAPVGELPAALSDCPEDAYFQFDGTTANAIRIISARKPQDVAERFRKYLKAKRDPSVLLRSLNEQLEQLAGTLTAPRYNRAATPQ